MTVRFFIRLSMASCTTFSDLLSSALVASSKMTTGAFFTKARAMAKRCFCPPESRMPRSPISVSSCLGRPRTNSSRQALFKACHISSSVTEGLPSRTFSRTVPANKKLSWNTMAILWRREERVRSRTSVPSMRIWPLCMSYKRGIRLEIVVFPPPELPTRATVSPTLISRLIPLSTSLSWV